MKKLKFVLAAILAALSMNAAADEATADPVIDFSYVSMSAGVNNRASSGSAITSPVWAADGASDGQALNVKMAVGAGKELYIPFDYSSYKGVGVEAGVFAVNGRFLPTAQVNGFYQPRGFTDPRLPIINPHAGYSLQTGTQLGLDVLVPMQFFSSKYSPESNLRFGVTKFQKDIEGASNVVQVGFIHTL